MDCPSCGLGLSGVTLARCPRCGHQLPTREATPDMPEPMQAPATRTSPLLPPLATVEPRFRLGRRLLVGALAALVVVAAATCSGIYLLGAHASTTQLQPLPSVTATLQGRLTYVNTLTNGVDGWATTTNCHDRIDGYHVKDGYVCFAPLRKVFDVDVYAQVKQVGGSVTRIYGIVFRGYDDSNFYSFGVNAGGDWGAIVCVDKACKPLAGFERNTAVLAGVGATNTLEALVEGTHFTFFINGVKVGEADDDSVGNGIVGLFASPGVEATFTNLMIAQPPNGLSYS